MPASEPQPPSAVRRRIRRERSALPNAVQRLHAHAATRHLISSGLLLAGRTFAAYCSTDGELDTSPLIEHLQSRRARIALPVVSPAHSIDFYETTPATRFVLNRYGIPEPDPLAASHIPAMAIDVVLAPLVAFDALGHRLGMGGGYYDRYLGRAPRRPLVVGLAHDLQRVESLQRTHWDVPLDAIATESGLVAFSARAKRFEKSV